MKELLSRAEGAIKRPATISDNYRLSRLDAIGRGEPISCVDFTLYGHALVQFRGMEDQEATTKSEALRKSYQLTRGQLRTAIETTVIGSCCDLLKIKPGLLLHVVNDEATQNQSTDGNL